MVEPTQDPLILLGKRAGGCTESCSEMHTFSWPCEQAFILLSDLSWWQRLRFRLARNGRTDASAGKV